MLQPVEITSTVFDEDNPHWLPTSKRGQLCSLQHKTKLKVPLPGIEPWVSAEAGFKLETVKTVIFSVAEYTHTHTHTQEN